LFGTNVVRNCTEYVQRSSTQKGVASKTSTNGVCISLYGALHYAVFSELGHFSRYVLRLDCGMDDKGIEIQFLVEANSFLFATIFRPVLGLTQIPTQWAP